MKTLIRYLFRRIKYYRTTPFNIKHDDLYIVAYPKSGITWLSFILANLEIIVNENQRDVTFFNIHQLIPDIHLSRNIAEYKGLYGGRLIKSHSAYNPFYNQVILLVRNPFDTMKSFYNFRKQRGYKYSAEKFVTDKHIGIKNWKKHFESWVNNERIHKIHIIKFEDLKNEPFTQIKNLCKNIGVIVQEEQIKIAIEKSSIEQMREKDKLMITYTPTMRSEMPFVRTGKAIGIKNNLPKKVKNIIYTETYDIINKYWKKDI